MSMVGVLSRQMTRYCLASVLALLGLLPYSLGAATIAPESLGTLLYSPGERSTIERARAGNEGPVANTAKSVKLKGLVRRGTGKGTSWVNGQTVPEGQPAPTGGVPVISPKEVTIDGKSLRVGETLDTESGAKYDIVPSDSTVKRQK